MHYSEFQPVEALRSCVECYWCVEAPAEEGAGMEQKIVPDGFTEIIFHYGDPYQFRNPGGMVRLQSPLLLAGQITKPVYLTPTGRSGVIGIKFKPTGIWKLFGWNMETYTDDTLDLDRFSAEQSRLLLATINSAIPIESKIKFLEDFLLTHSLRTTIADELIHDIDAALGSITMEELHQKHKLSVRKIERLFKEQVGVSAKRYSRIVRFRHVFHLLKKETWSKAEATYLAGYFDQSHFNKEFREFSGEDPGTYFAQHHEFANFFLNRPVVFLQD